MKNNKGFVSSTILCGFVLLVVSLLFYLMFIVKNSLLNKNYIYNQIERELSNKDTLISIIENMDR